MKDEEKLDAGRQKKNQIEMSKMSEKFYVEELEERFEMAVVETVGNGFCWIIES